MKMNHSQCKNDAKYHVHNSCYGTFPCYFDLSSFEPRHQTCEVFACGHYRRWPVKHWTFIIIDIKGSPYSWTKNDAGFQAKKKKNNHCLLYTAFL